MRRNMDRRHNTSNGAGGGGPLMTGHLHDIDLELELLKRKREMIEQQQQLLNMEQFNVGRNFDSYDNNMRFNEPQHLGSGRNYAQLYENRPSHSQFGKRRQPEPEWQHRDVSPKRNRSKRSNYQSNAHPQPGFAFGSNQQNGPIPLMSVQLGNKPSIGQKIASQKPPIKPHQRGFNPTKVSKPKASGVPNKIASKPLAERKKLVSASKETSAAGDVGNMLLPDREPSQQVSGRLELALGAVIKNIKKITDSGPHSSVLHSQHAQRVMKQAVRERIRTVMLGKIVGSLKEILAKYREEFPEETDMDIANIALEASGIPTSAQQETSFVPADTAEDFYRKNMNCLVQLRISEMFQNLEDLYDGKTPTIKTEDELTSEWKKKVEEYKEEKRDLEEYKKFLNTEMKPITFLRAIPRYLKWYIPIFKKLLTTDNMFKTTKTAITVNAAKKLGTPKTKAIEVKNEKTEGQSEVAAGDPNGSVGRSPTVSLPYYVKVMGKPALPKRKAMQVFLDKFHPKSIRRHRTIHNLLIVGLTEKTDFDSLAAADGTKIGKLTISVRVCTNNKDSTVPQNTELNNSDVSMKDVSDEDKNEKRQSFEIINPELDDQINDLLSSIRKEEEDKNAAGDNSANVSTENQDENTNQEDKSEKENEDEAEDKENKDDTTDDKNDDLEVDKENQNSELPKETIDTNDASKEPTDDPVPSKETDEINAKSEENMVENGKETDNSEVDKVENGNKNTATSNTDAQNTGDELAELKSVSGRSTPSRTSARLANVTPSTIRTRRASRLNQNL